MDDDPISDVTWLVAGGLMALRQAAELLRGPTVPASEAAMLLEITLSRALGALDRALATWQEGR